MMNFLGRRSKKDKKEPVRFDDAQNPEHNGQPPNQSKKKSKKGKKKTKRHKRKKERTQKPLDLSFEEVPPVDHVASLDETEARLLKLHAQLNEFYNIYKPENVDEDILTILMQFFIDAGPQALNDKLMHKYGANLDTYLDMPPPPNPHSHMSLPPPPKTGLEDLPPPPPIQTAKPNRPLSRDMAKTMERLKRNELEGELGINLPPPPITTEAMVPNGYQPGTVAASLPRSQSKKNMINLELDEYKERKERESVSMSGTNGNLSPKDDSVAEVSNTKEIDEDSTSNVSDFFEDNDDILKLSCLDAPHSPTDLTARDYIEAFYSKHDAAKLDTEEAILRFVRWVEKYSLEELSNKLEGKYGEGLYEFEKLAVRRKNLEKALTDFYLQHDRHKLDTRWTILKILAWTFQHGIPALNKKFETRYGQTVVRL